MKNLTFFIVLILSIQVFCSCNKVDKKYAEKLIEKIEEQEKIHSIDVYEGTYTINEFKFNNSEVIRKNTPKYLGVILDKPSLLDSLEIEEEYLNQILKLFKKTNVTGFDSNSKGQYYFIEGGFIDDHYGKLYSPIELEDVELYTEEMFIPFSKSIVRYRKHLRGRWYKASGA
ncbi:hypothetical protein [Marinifilum caeruleilacunae]|uniref:Uncharacterized protein n=1 Tax=Marinifilum caeruleilacunae TaxID=2499076 RepID=A0ABX1X202_9BACT|nr:hypothetical protein [Marinifilum caeruleilacunae]NOU62297.1 hypothetical protein [Marinifilum caeruleilacunae]